MLLGATDFISEGPLLNHFVSVSCAILFLNSHSLLITKYSSDPRLICPPDGEVKKNSKNGKLFVAHMGHIFQEGYPAFWCH